MMTDLIKIEELKIVGHKNILFSFSDGTEKTIDMSPFINEDPLSGPLSDPAYFRKVELYENGRGIFWPNGFDFCPDFLFQYQPEKEVELMKEE